MKQNKILLDTCSYLRLAESHHPLLGVEFGTDRSCLYVIAEFQKEYDYSSRITKKYPMLNQPDFKENRRKRINLSKSQKDEMETVIDAFEDYADDQGLSPSNVDLKALCVAYQASIPFVTDDGDLYELAEAFDVPVMRTLKLLKLMLDAKHITFKDLTATLQYIEHIPDKPKHFEQDKKELFGL